MGFFRNLRLKLRLARRVSAFKRGVDNGLSVDEARQYADLQYPPTQEDLWYEEEQRAGEKE